MRIAAAAMATSQLAQALPAASPVASVSGAAQRKPAGANLAAPFKGSVAGLRWESSVAIVAKVRGNFPRSRLSDCLVVRRVC